MHVARRHSSIPVARPVPMFAQRWFLTCGLSVCAAAHGQVDTTGSTPAASKTVTSSPYQPALPGTEDDPESGNPVYSDLTTAASIAAQAHDSGSSDALTAEQWLGRFVYLHSAMNYPAAAEAALRLVDAAPDRAISHYNLACVMSKLNRFESALAALNRAVDLGWRNGRHLSLDPDFESLRGTPELSRILDRIKTQVLAEKLESSPLRVDDGLDAIIKDLNLRMPDLLARYHVPGVSMAIVREGRVVWQGSFGMLESTGSVPLPADAVFRVRAPIHVIALVSGMQQQQAGRMQLAEVLRQADELDRLVDARSGRKSNNVLVDEPYPTGITPVSSRNPLTAGELGDRLNGLSRDASGGFAIGLLRMTVEMASEQEFDAYCTRSILQPLNMVSTSFAAPEPRKELPLVLALGHSALGTALKAPCAGEDRALGGCLYTSAQDMARLMEALIGQSNGHGNLSYRGAGSGPNCQRQSDDPLTVFASQMAMASASRGTARNSDRAPVSGLGIRVDGTPSGRRVTVLDRTDGQGCMLRWYPARQCGVVVMFNSATGADAAERIAHVALGGD